MNLSMFLEKKPCRSPFKKRSTPLAERSISYYAYADIWTEGEAKIRTPNGSKGLRWQFNIFINSISVSVLSSLASYFEKRDSNTCGTKRPSWSMTPLSEPCCESHEFPVSIHLLDTNSYIKTLPLVAHMGRHPYLCPVDTVDMHSEEWISDP